MTLTLRPVHAGDGHDGPKTERHNPLRPGAAGPGLVEEYVANVVTQVLQLRDQACGLKAYGTQLADGDLLESVAGLGAAIQITVREPGRPGEAVIEANFVLEGAVLVDVLQDQC